MSKIYEFSSQDALHDQASVWIAKLDRQLSHEEEDALKQWISQSPQHRALLLDMAAMWDRMDSLSRLSSLFPPPTKQAPRFTYARAVGLAASIMIIVTAGIWGLTHHAPGAFHEWMAMDKAAPVDSTYETNIGEHSSVNLPDGSRLVLNTDSLITVKYSKRSRVFHLLRGEVHIQVAHDTSRPLSVIAAGKVVQAIGTAFNVQIFEQQVELIVTEGKVLVADHDSRRHFRKIEEANLPQSAMAVSKGEKVILGSTRGHSNHIAKIEAHDIEANLSWRDGNLIFRGESLEEALREISRYTEMKFDITDEDIKNVRIAGLFKAGDINGLLATLEKNFNIKHEKITAMRVSLKGKNKD